MGYEVLTLQDALALNWRMQIKDLQAELAGVDRAELDSAAYSDIFDDAFGSPQVYFCLAIESEHQRIGGMYIATCMPVGLHRRLYIDGVVVKKDFRRQGVLRTVLIPHMKQLAHKLQCGTIDFTSSRPKAQAAYENAGFGSPTRAFRLVL